MRALGNVSKLHPTSVGPISPQHTHTINEDDDDIIRSTSHATVGEPCGKHNCPGEVEPSVDETTLDAVCATDNPDGVGDEQLSRGRRPHRHVDGDA